MDSSDCSDSHDQLCAIAGLAAKLWLRCVPSPPEAVTTVVEVEPVAVEATTISEEMDTPTPV